MNSTLKNVLLSASTAFVTSLLVLWFGSDVIMTKVDSVLHAPGALSTEDPARPLTTGGTPEEVEVIAAVKSAEPAVVSVIIAKDLPVVEQYFESPFGNDDPFGQLFPFGIPRERVKGTEHREIG